MTIREETFTHPQTKEQRKRFRVTYTADGKTRRKYFGTLKEAEAYGKRVERESKAGSSMLAAMSDSQRAELTVAFNRALDGGYRLVDALDHYEQHLADQVTNTVTVGDAVARYLTHCIERGLKDKSVTSLRQQLELFADHCSGRTVCSITASDVDEWIGRNSQWSNQSVNHALTKVGSLFRFCEDKGWCRTIPIKRSMKRKVERDAPCVMPPADAKRLLNTALDMDPEIALLLAVQLFAGLRPAEAETPGRSGIEFVDLDTGELAVKGKVERKRRLVTISDNLRRWIERVPGGWAQTNVRRRLDRVRRAASVDWGHDILRHSFASYHIAAHSDAAKTAFELGHSGNATMLYSHYRAVVSAADAQKFWSIVPPA